MKTVYLNSSDVNKDKWDKFVYKSPQGNIFVLSDFLDIINPEWNAVIVFDDNGDIQAAMPMAIKSKFGLRYAAQPILAKYWGIFFSEMPEQTNYRQFHNKFEFSKAIIEKSDRLVKYFSINFSPGFDYPMNFYWSDYKLNIKYTYFLELNKPYNEIRKNYKGSLKKKLSTFKAGDFNTEIDVNFNDHQKVFNTRFSMKDFKITPEYFEKLKLLYEHFSKKGMSKFYSVKSKSGEIVASVLFFYFRDVVYFYLGLYNPAYREFPVKSYIADEEIKSCCEKYGYMDFTGSMIEKVERLIRGFGARPVPYLNISKKKFPLNNFLV